MGVRMEPRFCILLVLPGLLSFLSASVEAKVYLWPQPRFVKWSGGPSISLSADFRINVPQHLELYTAARRYTKLIKRERWLPIVVSKSVTAFPLQNEPTGNSLSTLDVSVVDLVADLRHDVDETYEIEVHGESARATLTAQTAWGALRGLETFSQLVRSADDGDDDATSRADLVIDSGVTIRDGPLFPHRGVLLDVARNFYAVRDIKRTIRALGFNKLNVLHLHLIDSQSFSLEIKAEPELARRGSYGRRYTYSRNDIKDIVRYARFYGVRIIPEIDTPGHAASWGGAYPEIVTCLNEFWFPSGVDWADRFASEPGTGQLNPLVPKTYEVVRNVIDEVASLFPDSFYHAGGDEIVPACWMHNELIKEYLSAAAGNNTLSNLLTRFISTTRNYIDVHKKVVLYWEDVLLDATVNVSASILPQETTVLQTWNNGPVNTKRITAAGYRTVVSSYDFYYLDCGHGGWVGNDSRYDQNFNDDPTATSFNYGGDGGSYCAPFKTWARVYDYDITANLTGEEAALVLGGEVALWSEQADPAVLDARLWPRGSALAETLWSGNRDDDNPSVKRNADALERLNDWRYRLVSRGIGAEPLQPLWCLRNPRLCDLSS